HIENEKVDEQQIYCDRSQIKQVLINIIKNAIEATNKSGTIRIVKSVEHSDIAIDVIDEGPGIPDELIHKIGEPFFTTKQSGTGLGLMISKQILEQHGGRMDIMQNVEKGSLFRLILPKSEK